MQELIRWQILEAAPLEDESVWIEHFTGFVNSFVQKSRRERWLHLLLKRPTQIYSNSNKLHSHLDWSKCSRLVHLNQLNQQSRGMYYDFQNEPIILTVTQGFIVGPERDGIFSIIPGKLAIYFFHESENVLCQNQD